MSGVGLWLSRRLGGVCGGMGRRRVGLGRLRGPFGVVWPFGRTLSLDGWTRLGRTPHLPGRGAGVGFALQKNRPGLGPAC